MRVLGELLDRAVVDHQHRQADRLASGSSRVAARRRLLRAAAQPFVGLLDEAGEQVAAVVEQELGPRAHDLPRGSRRARPGPGSARRRRDAGARRYSTASGWVVFRLPVETSSRPAAQSQEERDGLRLEVDAGADRQARNGRVRSNSAPIAAQQTALLDHPLDPLTARLKTKGPLRGPSTSTSLDFVEALPADIGGAYASPPRWLGGSRQVTGTRLYELVPPLPVLEVSNAGPPPFRGYRQVADGSGRMPRRPGGLDRLPDPAVRDVVVDDSARLHRRVGRRRPDEAEACLAQALREGGRLRRGAGQIGQ